MMKNPKIFKKPKLKKVDAYALLTSYHTKEDLCVEVESLYMDAEDAIRELRRSRLGMHDGWIPPVDRETRDNYLNRNRIGSLWEIAMSPEGVKATTNEHGWGYRWYDPKTGSVVRLYVEKTVVWTRDGNKMNAAPDTADGRLGELLEDCDIEYDADRDKWNLPEDARYDDESEDLIFESEDEENRNESDNPETDHEEAFYSSSEGEGHDKSDHEDSDRDDDDPDDDDPKDDDDPEADSNDEDVLDEDVLENDGDEEDGDEV